MSLAPERIENIARVLTSLGYAVSMHELGARCRSKGLHINTPQLTSALRAMQSQGRAQFVRGRWIFAGEEKSPLRKTASAHKQKPTLSIPGLSEETKALLQGAPVLDSATFDIYERAGGETAVQMNEGPWSSFRRLLQYYRRCLQAEEGADASAYQNQIRQRFLYLENRNTALPKANIAWRHTISISPHIAPFLTGLPPPNSDDALVVGYPISALHITKEGEPPVSIVRPIFYFPVEYVISGGALHLYIDNPSPEVNLNWLDYAFKGRPEQQRAFLSACGMLNGASELLDSGLFANGIPDIGALACLLEAFLPHTIRESLDTRYIPGNMIHEPFKNGIYNRTVLMLAKRTKYTATLCRELKYIEDAPDSILDQTALAHLFKQRDYTAKQEQPLIHEAIVPEILPMNAEQRLAAASLLEKDVTVITGPPGTGKSQVVAAAIGGIRLKRQTLLFASRNHKALDAVIARICDPTGRPLIVRGNSKDDPNLKYTFQTAIRNLMAAMYDPDTVDKLATLRGEIGTLLQKRGQHAEVARKVAKIVEKIGRLEDISSNLRSQLSRGAGAAINTDFDHFPISPCRRILSLAQNISKSESGFSFLQKLRCLWAFFDLKCLQTYLRQTSPFLVLPGGCGMAVLRAVAQQAPVLGKMLQLAEIRKQTLPLEAQLRQMPLLEELTTAIRDATEMLLRITPEGVTSDVDSRQGLPPGNNREEIDGLRHALQVLETGMGSGEVEKSTITLLRKHLPTVLGGFPCWAVTSLSVGSRIPFFPGIFDLVVVDEASQSDIPSAIPLLFRAKRVGVVGDPWQLSHITKLSAARNTLLMKDADISVKDMRFSYTGNSLYDLVAGANDAAPILLAETYRSATDIAEYSNWLFYGGRLRVGTNMGELCIPPGVKPGVHWTEVHGAVVSAGQSGCYCQAEIDEIVRRLRVLLLENSFKGTIGVVTPFRQQATRLRDALFAADTAFYQALVSASCHVDTAHGFQGDERDVMFFSLCGDRGMPTGALNFLRETGRVFNVAVSRAKAVLHVVGNREWAAQCDISHIKRLAAPNDSGTFKETAKGEWYPHESPWEQILFKALQERGLEPRPQFQAGSRRLDMALVDAAQKIYLDIEVDGDCHRTSDGSRKTDDVWRDIQLQGMGWRVLRFWTYQLRENLARCVDSIEEAWRKNEPRT